ncbi:hypothetical protein MAR_002926 [Mya arenaria]|uniref:Uncharacterized protein n=1 Tax=Mya arenaria TaxID=6604 RepID=A0ABY7G4I5_MYAAR|nr:hypothetical protein MAR_002926 [Mya arenaria]
MFLFRAEGTIQYYTLKCDTDSLIANGVSSSEFQTTAGKSNLLHRANPLGVSFQDLIIGDIFFTQQPQRILRKMQNFCYKYSLQDWAQRSRSKVEISIPKAYADAFSATLTEWVTSGGGIKVTSFHDRIGVKVIHRRPGTTLDAGRVVLPDDAIATLATGSTYVYSLHISNAEQAQFGLVAFEDTTAITINYNEYTISAETIDGAPASGPTEIVSLDEYQLLPKHTTAKRFVLPFPSSYVFEYEFDDPVNDQGYSIENPVTRAEGFTVFVEGDLNGASDALEIISANPIHVHGIVPKTGFSKTEVTRVMGETDPSRFEYYEHSDFQVTNTDDYRTESGLVEFQGDLLDNDCDEFTDEEVLNGEDDDGDGDIDEDLDFREIFADAPSLFFGMKYEVCYDGDLPTTCAQPTIASCASAQRKRREFSGAISEHFASVHVSISGNRTDEFGSSNTTERSKVKTEEHSCEKYTNFWLSIAGLSAISLMELFMIGGMMWYKRHVMRLLHETLIGYRMSDTFLFSIIKYYEQTNFIGSSSILKFNEFLF